MKIVFTTGATGFVGRQCLEHLLNNNYEVHATSLSGCHASKLNLVWHKLNLFDNSAVEKLLQEIKPTHLLHCAWYTNPNDYWTSTMNIDWLNASINLLNKFIKVGGKRAVIVGSCAEYDWQKNVFDEFSTSNSPMKLYGTAKYALYLLSKVLSCSSNLSLAWGRLFFLFGKHESPQRLIPSAICTLLNNNKFAVKNGNLTRDYMYVNDVGNGLVALLDSTVEGPVNIASGKAVAIREIINMIASKLNANHLVSFNDGEVESQPSSITANVSRLKHEVKWIPTYSLNSAIEDTIDWWRSVPRNA